MITISRAQRLQVYADAQLASARYFGGGLRGLGATQALEDRDLSMSFATGDGRAVAINVTKLAETAIDGVAELVSLIKNPCSVITYMASRGQDYLNGIVTDAVSDMIENLSGVTSPLGGVDTGVFKDCAKRIQEGEKSCAGAVGAVASWVGSIGKAIGSYDFVDLAKQIIVQITQSILSAIVSALVTKLRDALIKAINAAVSAITGACSGSSSGAQQAQQPINSGTPGTQPNGEPIIASYTFEDTFTAPATNSPAPSVYPPPPPKPPPPVIAFEKAVPWSTYLVWGGTALGVGLVASKVLVGSWVPPVVRRKAAPLVSRIKRLRR